MADNHRLLRPKTGIEIPLHSVRKYVPGSGPPPPRISLAPPRDSTAYIIDQFVLPPDKDMTETSRKMIYYHIGFTDLPAVKILVPCDKVLDYVSPRELEDWEFKNMESKEEERARLRAKKQRAGASKRNPGRPPKVLMESVGASVLSPADETLLLAEEVAGPSLSTPKKRRPVVEVLDSEDMGETSNGESDDAAINRQLQADAGAEDLGLVENLEMDSESVDQLSLEYDTSARRSLSPADNFTPRAHDAVLQISTTGALKASLKSPSPAAPTVPHSNTSTPGKIHPAWAQAFGQPRPQISADSHTPNGHSNGNESPWTLLARSHQVKPPASTPGHGHLSKHANGLKNSGSWLSTPGAGASSSLASDASAGKRKRHSTGGTKPALEKPQKKSNKKQKVIPEPEPAADEWEVKDLLDDQWVVENGDKIQKYLVLWAGDWPPDQNPTWEPADNIQDQALVQRYQKKKRTGLLKTPKTTQKTLHRCLAGRQ